MDSDTFIREQIKAYFISHGHLDHISGFILNTPNDKAGKMIFGLNETINIIQQSYFNGQAWADFGPTGLKVMPELSKSSSLSAIDVQLYHLGSTFNAASSDPEH